MSITPYQTEELKVRGIYQEEGLCYGDPFPPVEKLTPPITPRENMRRFFEKEALEWLPDTSSDMIDLTPICNPDVDASDYEGGIDAFGVRWVADMSCPMLPAMAEPGVQMLDEIENWESLKFPDIETWDWKYCGKRYQEAYKDNDRMIRGIILNGFFERLISLMTFEEAAVSLITDSESVADFFNGLADMNIKIADHYIDDLGANVIMVHDDWSAQKSPFFSLDTAMDLLVPPLKKLVDHVHARGCYFILHSCGNGSALVPAMKAAGIDAWQAQENAIDFNKVISEVDGDFAIEMYLIVPDEIRGSALYEYLEDVFTKYCVGKRCCLRVFDMDSERLPETRKMAYELGRKLIQS